MVLFLSNVGRSGRSGVFGEAPLGDGLGQIATQVVIAGAAAPADRVPSRLSAGRPVGGEQCGVEP
ncbi:hypothetical protein ACFVHS_09420 [Streptomyces sp. NPDC057746]|uniref:hypothetical protein n=1 Tax=unclassified Streptomyces TaxID=2593676 RepID=UPI0036B586DA